MRQTRSMDIFSLGCVMHYCLTGGAHPFGGNYERDTNIMRGAPNLTALASSPEAANLVGAMLSKAPVARPAMSGVLAHPFWWGLEQRLQFLVDVSDRCGAADRPQGSSAPAAAPRSAVVCAWRGWRLVACLHAQHSLASLAAPSLLAPRVEFEDREPDQSLLTGLEAARAAAIGASNWGASMDAELVANLGKYRRYDYTSLRDLLRVVRNKKNHFREMPEPLQRLMGPVPDGYYRCGKRLLLRCALKLQHVAA